MNKVKRFNLEERYGYQNRKVIYDKNADNDIELNNIYLIIDLFNQLDEQIADLQKQLEEKEKMLEEYKKCNCKQCMNDYEKNLNQIIDKYLYENNSLKQQLAKLKEEQALENKEFKIGDRVVAVKPVGRKHMKGVKGTVIGLCYNELGVEFDEYIGGHDCSLPGVSCKNGYGWFCRKDEIKSIKGK